MAESKRFSLFARELRGKAIRWRRMSALSFPKPVAMMLWEPDVKTQDDPLYAGVIGQGYTLAIREVKRAGQ